MSIISRVCLPIAQMWRQPPCLRPCLRLHFTGVLGAPPHPLARRCCEQQLKLNCYY